MPIGLVIEASVYIYKDKFKWPDQATILWPSLAERYKSSRMQLMICPGKIYTSFSLEWVVDSSIHDK